MTSHLPPLLQATAGAIGSATGNAIVFPIDLATTRMQHARSNKKKLNLIQTLSRIISRTRSISSLYSGLGADTLSTILSSFLYFLIYTTLERIQRKVRERRIRLQGPAAKSAAAEAGSEILIGTIAGIVSKRLALPISAVCIRQQLDTGEDGDSDAEGTEQGVELFRNEKIISRNDHHGRSRGVLQTLSDLKRDKGFLGLFHVPLATTVPLALLPSLTLYFHERLLNALPLSPTSRARPSGLLTFTLGAISNALATLPLYPLMLSKAVSMSGMSDGQSIGGGKKQDRLLGALPIIYRREGVSGWYKGIEGQLVKGVIQHGITMLLKQRIEEGVVSFYRKRGYV